MAASKRGHFVEDSEIFVGAPEELIGLTGWSQSGGLVTGNRARKVTLQANFTNRMQSHLIQFNAPANTLNIPGVGIITEAEVIWKVRGNFVRRVLTVTDGASIAGCAEAAEVRISDQTLTNTARDYIASVQIAPGVRSPYEQPPQLRISGTRSDGAGPFPFAGTLTPGQTMTWAVPDDVGALSSYIAVGGSAPPALPLVENDIEVRIQAASGAQLKVYGFSGLFRWLPLTGSVAEILLVNRSVQNISVSCTLGIEG